MFIAISYKTKQFSLVLIKLGLVVAAFYFIYLKLFQNKDLNFKELIQNLTDLSSITTNTSIILVTLSFFNWFFEILKWQTLVANISKISFQEAASQSLGALTASLFTPNRIGEYGAKAMYYQWYLRKKIMLLNLLSHSLQMAMTTIFGTLGLAYFILYFQPKLNYGGLLISVLLVGIIVISVMHLLKVSWFKKQKHAFNRLINFAKSISKNSVLKTVLFSLMRYLIFSFQFYYLLVLFGIDLYYLEAMAAISTMYLLSSIIPSIFIFDVVIKGGVAVYVFGIFGIPNPIILSVVTLMWVLNFVLPSVIGSYHVLTFKLPKTVS